MSNAVDVKQLLTQEPWRGGQGRISNALDPTWHGKELPVCKGNIEWEKESKWWWCRDCGYCSNWSTPTHYVPDHPSQAYKRNLEFFYQQRAKQGISKKLADEQALHIMAVALKAAAVTHPMLLSKLADRILQEAE